MIHDTVAGYSPDEPEREPVGKFDHTLTLDGEPTQVVVEVHHGASTFEVRVMHCGCEVPLYDNEETAVVEIARRIFG